MKTASGKPGFTLLELLVVVSIISTLTSMLVPSLTAAREQARSTKCRSNLHNLGVAMGMYLTANNDCFWSYRETVVDPNGPGFTYFWGTPTRPVGKAASPFLKYCDYNLMNLWCPSFAWGTYVPQGGVVEPTTTYGYNAWCLDPGFLLRKDAAGRFMTRKRSADLKNPAALFVFNDSAMYWAPAGVPILQNSTFLEPVTGMTVQQPTTHFRHSERTNALCADGHATTFDPEGGPMPQPEQKLGFVGPANVPHYDQY